MMLFQGGINRDLIVNLVAYLSGEEESIAIRPNEIGKTQITLTPSSFWLYLLGFIVPLPLLMLGLSIFLGVRWRHA